MKSNFGKTIKKGGMSFRPLQDYKNRYFLFLFRGAEGSLFF